ncbi:MAG: hypothetical protein L0214_13720, partial [candidate division NC10 bacterium]|nr:hypothetical protein [candidate division NC10 bacterium]
MDPPICATECGIERGALPDVDDPAEVECPPGTGPDYGGTPGGRALNRAAAAPGVVPRAALPPLRGGLRACAAFPGSGQVNPASGNFVVRTAPPAADAYAPRPIFTYNGLLAAETSEVGAGW